MLVAGDSLVTDRRQSHPVRRNVQNHAICAQ
jgi:hypothetical protein